MSWEEQMQDHDAEATKMRWRGQLLLWQAVVEKMRCEVFQFKQGRMEGEEDEICERKALLGSMNASGWVR